MAESEFVTRASRGEEAAYRELFNRYFPMVYRIAFAYTQHCDEAKDVAQETFIRAFNKLNTIENPENFKAWISQITRSTALNKLEWRHSRREAPILTIESIDRFLYVPPQEDDRLDERRKEIVHCVIEEIPKDRVRETVALFYTGAGLSVEQISEKQGIPVSTVTTRLNRFRAKYKSLIMSRILELRGES